MKKKIISSSVLLILVLVGIFIYYKLPLSADELLPEKNKINKIYFSDFIDDNGVENLSIEITKPEEIREIIEVFESTKYTRSLGNKNIKNDTRFLNIYFFSINEDRAYNYTIEINEKGQLLINNRKYTIEDDKSKIFERILSILNIL